jgi:hypothetical protein
LTKELSREVAFAKITRTWERYCLLWWKQLEELKLGKNCPLCWLDGGAKAVTLIEEELQKEFGDFKVIKTEERLVVPVEYHPQIFKGFLDLTFEQVKENKIIIADFKSCSSHFMFNKYRDKYKDYQLTLYKHFYCQKYNIDPKNVETYFITIERSKKPSKPLLLTRVTSSTKKTQNALQWLQTALGAINRGTWIRNRSSCFKYGDNHPCPFYRSELCK